jgi:hypothetical protein
MGIFDGIIFCHYNESREDFYKKALKENKYNVYKITDAEIIMITNDIISVI